MPMSRAPELAPLSTSTLTSSCTFLSTLCFSNSYTSNKFVSLPMRSSLSIFRSLSLSLSHHCHPHRRFIRSIFNPPCPYSSNPPQRFALRVACYCTSVEQLSRETSPSETEQNWDFSIDSESEAAFEFDQNVGSLDLKHSGAPALDVKELGELPEQWRRSRLAWLCKELPGHKGGTLDRILNAQRKWMTQEDATYVVVHCTRIRENEAGFKVYKWMMQQHWYQFDFALATKLADYMGKERKFSKCREIFNYIINQGRVPSESTFHVLIVAYLSAPVQGCLEEACSIYNRMIQLGGYQPRLSLHNSLFRALVSKSGSSSKHYLKQAEYIFHNLVTSGLEIHKDIYGGLIWLHSYQDTIDKERILSLREEMQDVGIEEGIEVLLSILRVCSKNGDVKEAERTWCKLLRIDGGIKPVAFVYKMEVYAKVGDPMKSLEIFREMQEQLSSTSVAAYHEIIEVFCKAQEVELAESLMIEFIKSNFKPLTPSYIHMMNMYFNLSLHDKLELAFSQCLEKCRPNLTIYSIYLNSLVKIGDLDKAEEIFNQMRTNGAIGVNSRSCNTILGGYLSSGDHAKAEKIYDLMCQKRYDIDSPSMEKLDYVLSLSRKQVKKPISLKLSIEQREILVGLLLGGLQISSDEERKNHMLRFKFSENSSTHSALKRHIHDQYHEWLHPSYKAGEGADDIPSRFCTISHSYFGFYADQFWPKGRPVIPKLIHRWLSPRALAFWYMYGGYRTSSGDILLKLKGTPNGVGMVVKALKSKSLDCRVKKKGRLFWIGFLGSNSSWFWKLIEPYVLEGMKDSLKAALENSTSMETEDMNYDSGFESDEMASNYEDDDSSGIYTSSTPSFDAAYCSLL